VDKVKPLKSRTTTAKVKAKANDEVVSKKMTTA